jgi:phosphoribosylformylglycinamidine synthase
MDLKEPGNSLFLIGVTKDEMGGSHFNLVNGLDGGVPPQVDMKLAPRIFQKLHEAIKQGFIRSCHDLSEGGLGVTLAEMCLAGGWGANVDGSLVAAKPEPGSDLTVSLFSESNTRFVIEVRNEHENSLISLFSDLPCRRIGTVTEDPQLLITVKNTDKPEISASVADLKEAWQKPLHW